MASLEKLIGLLDPLEAKHLNYTLGHYGDSISVLVVVSGARWEIRFFVDGRIEMQVFRSTDFEEAEGGRDQFFKEHGL